MPMDHLEKKEPYLSSFSKVAMPFGSRSKASSSYYTVVCLVPLTFLFCESISQENAISRF